MEHALAQPRPGYRKHHPSKPQRPRLDATKARVGAGIVLTDVSDDQIMSLIDAGLSRLEIAQHYGVADHIVRYRIRVMRDRKILPEKPIAYGRFFIDDMCRADGRRFHYQIPSHRRAEWETLKRIAAKDRPKAPGWALEMVDFSLLEFSAPKSFGAYTHGGHA